MAIEFNTEFYVQSKFAQLEAASRLEEFGLTDVASLAQFFEDNGVDARTHYLNSGMREGINPSAEFDTNAYLEDKLAELQNAEKYGDTYADFTVADVIAAFQAAGLTALEHFNTFGEAEGLEATPVAGETAALTEAVAALQAAVVERDAVLEELARTELEADATDAQVAAAVQDIVDNGTGDILGRAETAVDDADLDLRAEEATLATARSGAGNSDANLRADLTNAQAAINADTAASNLQNELTQAENRLSSDQNTVGSDRAVAERLVVALDAYLAAGGADADSFSDFIDAVSAELSKAEADRDWEAVLTDTLTYNLAALVDVDGNFAGTELVGGNAELRVAVREAAVEAGERAELIVERDDALTDFQANALGADFITAQEALADREELIENVAEAREELEEAQAFLATVEALISDLENAQDSVDEQIEVLEEQFGIDNVETLTAGNVAGSNDESDLYLFTEDTDSGVILTNFEAEDFLFLGTDLVRTDLETGVDITDTRVGSNSALEVFVQQDGANTVLFVEQFEGAGNMRSDAELVQITLNGVNSEDLDFSNGFISIVEAA